MMKLKRAFIGGYKKSEVDFLAQQWEENEALYNSRISILEGELKLLKENSDKEIKEYNLKISEKEKMLDQVKNTLEISEKKITSLKEDLAKEKNINTELSKTINDNQNVVRLYEAEIMRLGRLYLDALDYSEKIKTQAKENSTAVVNNIFSEILKTESEYSEFINYINNNRKVIEDMAEKIESSLTDIRKYLRESESGISDIGQIYLRLEDEKNYLIRSIRRDDAFTVPKINNNTTPKPDTYTTPKPDTYTTPKPDAYTTPKPDTYTTPKPDIYSTPETINNSVSRVDFSNSYENEKDESANKGDYSKYLNEIEKKYTEDSITKTPPKPSIKDILEKYSNMN